MWINYFWVCFDRELNYLHENLLFDHALFFNLAQHLANCFITGEAMWEFSRHSIVLVTTASSLFPAGIMLIIVLSHFQEDCSLEKVWNMGGLSILTSAPLMPPYVCFLCASKGQHEVSAQYILHSFSWNWWSVTLLSPSLYLLAVD